MGYMGYEAPPTQGLPVVSPAHMLPVQVAAREAIAPGVVSVRIVLPGTRQAPAPYLPGQFVTLALPTPRETLYRSYSLCGDGDMGNPWELAIKRMDGGAVSTYFYDSVKYGTLLYSSMPRGTFTLPPEPGPDMVLVMVAAGSGITPIMGMLRAIARMRPDDRPLVQLHYASRSWDDVIFGDELGAMDPNETWLRQWHYLSSERNRMTVDAVLRRASVFGARAHWYMCGAEGLKRELQAALSHYGVPSEQVHAEIFATRAGPAYRVAGRSDSNSGGQLTIEETGAVLDVRPSETILAALERHSYRPDFSCRAGACGACRLQVLAGQVDTAGESLSEAERDEGYVLSCIAHPLGDVTLASGGRPPAGVARRAGAGAGRTAAASRGAVRTLVRAGALAGVGALVLGSWNLTNHRPLSWGTASAAPPAPSSAPSGGATPGANSTSSSGTATPGASTTQSAGGGTTPSAAATPAGSGSGGQPQPTATTSAHAQPTPTPVPVAPTATPAPKPTPTCVSTPSKPC